MVNFFSWFIDQVISIFSFCFISLARIQLAPNVTLLDFTITVFILGIVISILVAQPGNAMRVEKKFERRKGKE